MNVYPEPPRPRRSFLATAALGISLVTVTLVTGVTGIILYGMNIADRKSDNLIEVVQHGIQNLPELRKSLPPVLSDAIDDVRRPDYASQLGIDVRLARDARRGGVRPVIDVTNRGEELVSMLSIRVTVLNEENEPVAEFNEWVATPIAADGDWRGPLMAGAKRSLSCGTVRMHNGDTQGLHAQAEVTDVRVWKAKTGTGAESVEVDAGAERS